MNHNHYNLLTILLYLYIILTFPAKLSLKCKLKLMLITDTFYGNHKEAKTFAECTLTASCIKNLLCVRSEP